MVTPHHWCYIGSGAFDGETQRDRRHGLEGLARLVYYQLLREVRAWASLQFLGGITVVGCSCLEAIYRKSNELMHYFGFGCYLRNNVTTGPLKVRVAWQPRTTRCWQAGFRHLSSTLNAGCGGRRLCQARGPSRCGAAGHSSRWVFLAHSISCHMPMRPRLVKYFILITS